MKFMLELLNMTQNFEQQCYQLMRLIPKGRVTTYAEIARALNSKGYRAVGNACNKNPDAPATPCHRVIKSDGCLGGYAYGLDTKIKLLKSENVIVKNNKIDLDKFLFKYDK